MLPSVNGLRGIDIGCGEGYNTRLLAALGADMTGIDISENFIRMAREEKSFLPIRYIVASALVIPFEDESLDFATAFMSLMDIPETRLALEEAFRVIRKGGFLQFSILHPCFNTVHRKNLRNAKGETYAIEVGGYFENQEGKIDEWIFAAVPAAMKKDLHPFRLPLFTRTLSQWINMLVNAGFVIECMQEPTPDDETVKKFPGLQDARIVPYFLHLRCRKPL